MSASEVREFVVALEGFLQSFHKEQRGLFRDRNVTPVQYFVIRWLARESAANMSSLAAMLGVRPQTVTAIVDSLEAAGWVRRERSREDRREALLRLTPKGERLLDSIREAFIDQLGETLRDAKGSALPAATDALRTATTRLLEEEDRPLGVPLIRPRAKESHARLEAK